MKTNLLINGKSYAVKVQKYSPLLCKIRDIGLTGTKFGCNVSPCGTCSVPINGKLTKSCSIQVVDAIKKEIFTVKETSENLEILRQTWTEGNVPQSGYCQYGRLIAANSLFDSIEKQQIEISMTR